MGTETPATGAKSRYLLGDSPAEVQQLVEQARVYAPEAEELLGRIGLQVGASAIDIGCGVPGILHLLADRVGRAGRIVGLDREPRMVETGRQLARKLDLDVELIEADATATGLHDDSFNLVHARTPLLNVANPEEILTEMIRIAKPGGVIALQKPDASAWGCDPPHPAFEILRAEILSAYRRTGKDFSIGRRIARMLTDARLADVQVRATAKVTAFGDYYQTFQLTIATLVRSIILDAGRLTADEFDSYALTLRNHLEDPRTRTCQPLMWQAWGRKPTAALP
ncbi:MAG: methyltransferase domain-containing protein [Solirubrobacterales bacterium]|nr:methyltransferase domain-containing protein [Solirubrobacterales bacterium]